jgi:hypothetical protein
MRLRDVPVLVDDVRDPFRVLVLRRISSAVCQSDLPIRIAQQRKREVILLGELRVRGRVIEADAEHRGVLRFILRAEVPEPGTLGGSPRCIGLRIKPKHDLASAQISQRDRAPAMIAHLKIRSLVANLEHASSSERTQYKPQLACQRHAADCNRLRSLLKIQTLIFTVHFQTELPHNRQ